jgi:multidrug efflux system membrane fusion protein
MRLGKIALMAIPIAVATVIVEPQLLEGTVPGWTAKTEPLRILSGLTSRPASNQRVAVRPSPVFVEDVKEADFSITLSAVGTVQPIASVALRSRIDAMIDKLDVNDGAAVVAGERLIELDARQIRAQIKQNQAILDKDKAAREQAARDVSRAQQLLQNHSGPQLNLDNAQTALQTANAAIDADTALIDNLKVQESWYTISAPISGRLGIIASKPGNLIRTADNSTSGILATINQIAPIYVSMLIPQVYLAELRNALSHGDVQVSVTPQGGSRSATGKIAEVEPTVDVGTGTVGVRALMKNDDELLWPGQLCNATITLQTIPNAISIARSADQVTADGDFVYVVDGNVARLRYINVTRSNSDRYLVTSGLHVGEKIVVDGQLTLADGAPVSISTRQSSLDPAHADAGK